MIGPVFLSNPYWNEDAAVRESNRERCYALAAELRRLDVVVISPLHESADAPDTLSEGEWLAHALRTLSVCPFAVFASGWRCSKGCHAEHELAELSMTPSFDCEELHTLASAERTAMAIRSWLDCFEGGGEDDDG